jgi:regulatory protein
LKLEVSNPIEDGRDRGEGRSKEAMRKAMHLLMNRDRSEQELRDRLAQAGFEEPETEEALAYVKSYGYVNDRRYAENYVISAGGKKSRRMLRSFLEEKGVADDLIEAALDQLPEDETELVTGLLLKKAGPPHSMDEKELRRVFAYLARKGFTSSDIWRALREYQAGGLG